MQLSNRRAERHARLRQVGRTVIPGLTAEACRAVIFTGGGHCVWYEAEDGAALMRVGAVAETRKRVIKLFRCVPGADQKSSELVRRYYRQLANVLCHFGLPRTHILKQMPYERR